MRPTAQRAVSRRRLIAKGIFSMSGPLSLLVRSVISLGSSGPICFIMAGKEYRNLDFSGR